MKHSLLKLLGDPEFSTLSLILCLIFSKSGQFKIEKTANLCDKKTVKDIHSRILQLKNDRVLNINDRQISREFNKTNILKELIRLDNLEVIYFGIDKEYYYSKVLVTNHVNINPEFWVLYINGTSTTKNILKFVLEQVINSLRDDVMISVSFLLQWIKDNTSRVSVSGSKYTYSMKVLTDSGFLTLIGKYKYSFNEKYLSFRKS